MRLNTQHKSIVVPISNFKYGLVKYLKEWILLVWVPTDLKFNVFFIIAGGGCWFEDTVVHEFIHAFGFHHEQVRPDRDNYVEIIYENIPEVYYSQFNVFTGSLTFGVDYDGQSVMHYRSKDFSSYSYGNGNTIESKVVCIMYIKDHP